MSTRFVAPPPPPPLPAPQNTSQSAPVKHDQLPPPPPLHPALARRRTPIPLAVESVGALNSSPVSRSVSPAPPLPLRPSQIHEENLSTLDTQSSPTGVLPQPMLSDMQPSDLDSTYTQSSSNVSLAPSEVPGTPLLLVTPVEAASVVNASHQSSLRTDTLPPYAYQPALPTQIYPKPPEHSNGAHAQPPGLDTSVSGLQYRDIITETPAQCIPSPPIHPNRQPSLSPSFINLPVPSHPALRHRAQSNGSDHGLDTPITRPAKLERSRRGSGESILTLKNENLTDEDLRNMYDAEELERYLRLFASRVNEVAMHPDHKDASAPAQILTEEEDWVSLASPPPKQTTEPTLPPNLQSPTTPFEYIAALIYPYILQTSPPPTKRRFKLSRAANSARRLYLATYPAYVPPLIHLVRLSTWRNPKKSGLWCAVFWAAWAAGLLTPLILGRILYAMHTGGTVTRREIRQRREAAREAEALGRAIQGGVPGIGVSGDLNIRDVAKLVRGLGKKKQKKAKSAMENIKKDEGEVVVGAEDDTEDPDDWKLLLVDIADELADLHERVKNIFLHRRPAATRFYTIALGILFVGSPFVQNTSKLITFYLGFFFWFIPPVVKHLPKLPPAFSDAPTDAEVAIDLITQRVAKGERVVPERIPWRKKDKENVRADSRLSASVSNLNLTDTPAIQSPSMMSLPPGSDESEDETAFVMPSQVKEAPVPPEDRVRKGAVRAWNWLGTTKQLMDQVRGVEGQGTVYASPEQSFPAQHHSRPGMLIISPTLLTFSPLFASSTPAVPSPTSNVIKVDNERLRGVKKVSPGGLVIRYVKGSEIVEERFLLVVGRDQAFATLVGWGGGRWKHV